MYQQNPRDDYVDSRKIIAELQGSSSRMYSEKDCMYNVDNCDCPECMCVDPDLPAPIKVVGAAVLAASSPVLLLDIAG